LVLNLGAKSGTARPAGNKKAPAGADAFELRALRRALAIWLSRGAIRSPRRPAGLRDADRVPRRLWKRPRPPRRRRRPPMEAVAAADWDWPPSSRGSRGCCWPSRGPRFSPWKPPRFRPRPPRDGAAGRPPSPWRESRFAARGGTAGRLGRRRDPSARRRIRRIFLRAGPRGAGSRDSSRSS
jgi:hypothetical protein